MKIAISAVKNSKSSDVDARFGRAPFFAIYNDEDGSYSFVGNEQNLNAASGAGVQAAQNVAATGAKVLITGNCGPKAFKALSAAGIKVAVQVGGTIVEAVEEFESGRLKFLDDANVDGHWQ